MRSIFGGVTRRSVAVAAIVLYTLPLLLGAATGALHAAGHLADLVTHERDRLAALGLVHDSGAPVRDAPPTRGAGDASVVGFVHEHGGTLHAHGGPLSGALDGKWADRTAQGEDGDEASPAFHLPTTWDPARQPAPPATDAAESAVNRPRGPSPAPPIRPPRA